MSAHRRAAAAAAAVCIAVGVGVFALTAAGAAPVAAKSRPHAPSERKRPEAKRLGILVHNFSGKDAVGIITNVTPYAWTLVAKYGSWDADFPATLKPGENFIYRARPFKDYLTTQKYVNWFVYRADTALNRSEYLSVYIRGAHCGGICDPLPSGDGPPLSIQVNNTSGYPGFDNGTVTGNRTVNPEIGWTESGHDRRLSVRTSPGL